MAFFNFPPSFATLPHEWKYSTTNGGEERTCTICGRCEEFHDGGIDSFRVVLIPGDANLHRGSRLPVANDDPLTATPDEGPATA